MAALGQFISDNTHGAFSCSLVVDVVSTGVPPSRATVPNAMGTNKYTTACSCETQLGMEAPLSFRGLDVRPIPSRHLLKRGGTPDCLMEDRSKAAALSKE